MKKTIDYVAMFKVASILSIILVGGSIVMFFTKGLNYGVDFRGGVEIQVRMKDNVSLGEIRELLDEKKVPMSQLQSIGNDDQHEFLLKLESDTGDLNAISTRIQSTLAEKYGQDKFEILKTDIVGPKAGAQLRTSAFQAVAWAILAIMIYLALRFDYKFAPGAIAALLHDVIIIMGCFIVTQKEFSLQIIAAILAIIGYSVNDTVVIYDRVREIEAENTGVGIVAVINRALNETMSRTIITSATVLGVSLVMLFLGGSVIHDFFFAMTVGIVLGVYSTIFIAIPMTVVFDKIKTKNA